MTAKLFKLFLLEVVAGGAGAVGGSMLGNAFGRGGLFLGAAVGGIALVIAAGYLACRLQLVDRRERLWVIAGGVAGFLVACMVTIATLSSPLGPFAASLLIGIGAVLGTVLARSPHGEP